MPATPLTTDEANAVAQTGHAQVLIVGGGATGMSAALLLAHQSVPVTVIERRTTRSTVPRAHVVNPRTLEIFRAFGLDVERMAREAADPRDDARLWFVTRLVGGQTLGSLPFEQHDDTYTPHPRLNLAQPKLEAILAEELHDHPLVDFRPGHRVTGLDSAGALGGEHSALRVERPDGTGYRLTAEYVLACDGASSPLRAALGIEMRGQPDVMRCLTVHIEGNLRDLVADRPGMMYWILNPKSPGGLLAYDIDRTWGFLMSDVPETVPGPEEVREMIYENLGTRDVEFSVEHIVPWTMTAQVADRYAVGRVFLLGDAAHRFPPAGGLGLNTGVQDAHNLAWKLAAVIAGTADARLLDSYGPERRPVAQMNTDQSLKNAGDMGGIFGLDETSPAEAVEAAVAACYDSVNSLGIQLGFSYAPDAAPPREVSVYEPSAAVGSRLPHAWCTVEGRRASTLDLLDPRQFTLLTTDQPENWQSIEWAFPVTVRAIGPDSGVDVPADWLSLTGLAAGGAVLVRPDGHVFGRVQAEDAAGAETLAASLAALAAGQ